MNIVASGRIWGQHPPGLMESAAAQVDLVEHNNNFDPLGLSEHNEAVEESGIGRWLDRRHEHELIDRGGNCALTVRAEVAPQRPRARAALYHDCCGSRLAGSRSRARGLPPCRRLDRHVISDHEVFFTSTYVTLGLVLLQPAAQARPTVVQEDGAVAAMRLHYCARRVSRDGTAAPRVLHI